MLVNDVVFVNNQVIEEGNFGKKVGKRQVQTRSLLEIGGFRSIHFFHPSYMDPTDDDPNPPTMNEI